MPEWHGWRLECPSLKLATAAYRLVYDTSAVAWRACVLAGVCASCSWQRPSECPALPCAQAKRVARGGSARSSLVRMQMFKPCRSSDGSMSFRTDNPEERLFCVSMRDFQICKTQVHDKQYKVYIYSCMLNSTKCCGGNQMLS